MTRHQLPANTFANYAWGAYVIWKLYPRYRDFIDGRANTLFSVPLLDDYLTLSGANQGWQQVLRRYRVGNVLVSPGSPLAQGLMENRGWREIYHDRVSLLFTRGPNHSERTS